MQSRSLNAFYNDPPEIDLLWSCIIIFAVENSAIVTSLVSWWGVFWDENFPLSLYQFDSCISEEVVFNLMPWLLGKWLPAWILVRQFQPAHLTHPGQAPRVRWKGNDKTRVLAQD